MSEIKLRNLADRYLHFLLFAKGEGEGGRKGANHAKPRHPPDVPDECEAGDDGKKRGHKSGWGILGHFDRLIPARLSFLISFRIQRSFEVPKGVVFSDTRLDCKIPGRWRRGG